MEVPCEYCGARKATVFCRADNAKLCLSCDRSVHEANALSLRHERTLLCDACGNAPASFRCSEENLSLCLECDASSHSAVPASHHKRVKFDFFTGCPSANELAVLWGCRLGSLEDAPVKAEPRSPALPPADSHPRAAPGWGSSLPPKASRLGMELARGASQGAGWPEAKAGPPGAGSPALYGAPAAPPQHQQQQGPAATSQQQQQQQQQQQHQQQQQPPQQAFLGPPTPSYYPPLEQQQTGMPGMGGQAPFLAPQGAQPAYPGLYQQGPYPGQLYQPFPPPTMQQGYPGPPRYGEYQDPYGRQYAPQYAGQPFQHGYGMPSPRPRMQPAKAMGTPFGGRPGLESPSGMLSQVKVRFACLPLRTVPQVQLLPVLRTGQSARGRPCCGTRRGA
ncbi:hypothetical protein KFL_002790070, partial [Klebsormidium nitens]